MQKAKVTENTREDSEFLSEDVISPMYDSDNTALPGFLHLYPLFLPPRCCCF